MSEFSKRFSFSTWSYYDERASRGSKAILSTHVVPAEACYVHVLRGPVDEQPSHLFTIWVDEEGKMAVVTTASETAAAETDAEDASLMNVPSDKLTLMHRLAGDLVHHYFFGASFQLDADGLKLLCESALEILPPVDLGINKSFASPNDGDGHKQPASIPILDPMAIALGYAKHSLAHHDELFNRHLADTTVLAKLIVGRQLTSLLRDPEFKSPLSDELDITAMESELKEIQDKFARLAKHRSRVADRLVDWLQTPAFEFAERCYRDQEEAQYPDFLERMATVVQALKYSALGRKLLNTWLSDPPYFIQNYLPKSNTGTSANNVRKTVLASKDVSQHLFEIWLAFPSGIGTGQKLADHLSDLANRFNNTFGAGRAGHQPLVIMTDFDVGGFRIQPNEKAQWATHVSNRHQMFKRLSSYCALLGGVVAVQTLADDKSNTLKLIAAGNSLTGATLGALKTFGETPLQLGSATIKALKVAGSLASIASDTFSAIDASNSGDGSKAIGHGLSASAVIFWGAAGLFVGSTAGVVLLSAAVLAAIGGLALTAFTTDSELEAFAKHCFWGNRFGLDTNKFAGTDLAEWKNNPQLQVEALLHIIFGFTVAQAELLLYETGKGGIEIIHGAILPDSIFHVEWTLRYRDGPDFVANFTLKPGTKEVKELTGTKLRPQVIQWHNEPGEKPKIVMERPYLSSGGFRLVVSGTCHVWLDPDGTGQHREPSLDNKSVPWNFRMEGTQLDPDPPRKSADY